MTPEEELGMTLDQLIYKYNACGSRVADLLRELKQARPDAKRYRWLRDSNGWSGGEMYGIITQQRNAIWDERIDAAMETK